jgi:Ca2+/Na+ antiporter
VHVPTGEPIELIKWGYRLLYLQVFIFVIMSMFYFDNPVTFAYLGAILSLFYVALVWKQYNGEKEIDARTAILMYKPKNDDEEEKERE